MNKEWRTCPKTGEPILQDARSVTRVFTEEVDALIKKENYGPIISYSASSGGISEDHMPFKTFRVILGNLTDNYQEKVSNLKLKMEKKYPKFQFTITFTPAKGIYDESQTLNSLR